MAFFFNDNIKGSKRAPTEGRQPHTHTQRFHFCFCLLEPAKLNNTLCFEGQVEKHCARLCAFETNSPWKLARALKITCCSVRVLKDQSESNFTKKLPRQIKLKYAWTFVYTLHALHWHWCCYGCGAAIHLWRFTEAGINIIVAMYNLLKISKLHLLAIKISTSYAP